MSIRTVITPQVLAAANRIEHGDYSGSHDEVVAALAQDAALVAGAISLLATEPS